MSFTKVSKVFAGRTKFSVSLVQVNLSLELFENRIFVRGPSDFPFENRIVRTARRSKTEV